jgi:glycerophosphoryl diester phosphodiesterase
MTLPQLIAHRGYALRHPENTLEALAAAIAAGARWLEVDVQLSSDGVPFLFHDRTLRALCGVRGPLHEKSSSELAELRVVQPRGAAAAAEGRPIARLEQLVELLGKHRDVRAFIELKRIAVERFGAAKVLAVALGALAPVEDRCALISFSIPTLLQARQVTELPVGAVLEGWGQGTSAAVRELEPEFVFADVRVLPRKGALTVGQGGRAQLAVYEVADPELALRLADRGAQFVETFAIAEMLAALEPSRPA